jgi:hypothetical protein
MSFKTGGFSGMNLFGVKKIREQNPPPRASCVGRIRNYTVIMSDLERMWEVVVAYF